MFCRQDEFPILCAQPTFRDFVCMYIGEGYKRDRNVVSICNSDPAVIRLGDRWIRELASNRLVHEFQYHVDQNPDELRAFWGGLLHIEPASIKVQRKSNSGKLGDGPTGARNMACSRSDSDTDLRARLDAWMDRVRGEWP